MRQRERRTRQDFLDQLANPQFVRRIRDRPQQTHADRLDVLVRQALEQGAHGGFVERRFDAALGVDALRHLERVTARDVRIGIFNLQVVRFGLAAFFQQQDVRESRGGEKRRARDFPLDDAVRRPRRAVDEQARVGNQRFGGNADFLRRDLEACFDTRERTLFVGQGLADRETAVGVGNDDIGECTPGVDGNSIGHEVQILRAG